jgi:heme/copper-type cytochrome/quinol oxidase subunit 3
MTDMELNSIMTRVGQNTKIIFCGDFRQTDLNKRYDMSGLKTFMSITNTYWHFVGLLWFILYLFLYFAR